MSQAMTRLKSLHLREVPHTAMATRVDTSFPCSARNLISSSFEKARMSFAVTPMLRYILAILIWTESRGRLAVRRITTGFFLNGIWTAFKGKETPVSSSASVASICTCLSCCSFISSLTILQGDSQVLSSRW